MARILVVEDEPDILLLYRLNLEHAGHDVLLAADGMVALERIAAERPDVVVLDIRMPVLDGWAVLAQLQEADDPTPVVVVSAHVESEKVQRVMELGAARYFEKSVDIDVLLQEIERLLNPAPTGSS